MSGYGGINVFVPGAVPVAEQQQVPPAVPVAAPVESAFSCCVMDTIKEYYQTAMGWVTATWENPTIQSIRSNHFGVLAEKILLLAVLSLAVSILFFAIMGLAVIAPFMAFAALEVAKWSAIIGLVGVGVGCVVAFGGQAIGCFDDCLINLNKPSATPSETPPASQ